ncbi:hypothetical protein HKL94_01330 [Candidatus Parcubacteria bacterium]|nr:hypothetical protein [Candidatus Parcubacteria bacterium]
MSWAARRRFLILFIVGTFGAALLAVVLIATFYRAPSCSDGIQNEGETGIDCGGPCPYLCTAQEQPPTVLFTQTIQNGEGRTDAIAEVENKNPNAAAKNVPYSISFYGADQVLVGEVTGTLDLPPSTIVPIFVPGVSSGNQAIANAFLEINPSSFRWLSMPTDPRVIPTVSPPNLGGTASNPSIEAVLSNPSATVLTNVRAVVLVHNSKGDVIAASATIIPSIPAQGQATAIFTWNGAFTDVPALIEVIPIIPLP